MKSPNIIQFWHILVQTITKPGDNILFLTPTFNRFVLQAEHLGRSMLEVELETVNNRFEINFEALEECFKNNKITYLSSSALIIRAGESGLGKKLQDSKILF